MVGDKNRVPWSGHEIETLEALAADGCDAQQIATALGRSLRSVQGKLYRLSGTTNWQPGVPSKIQKRRTGGASFFLS
jgi:hypothetical protein